MVRLIDTQAAAGSNRAVAAAGTPTMVDRDNGLAARIGLGAILTLVLGLSLLPAQASAATADKGAWFKSLLQPGTTVPCCDASDCHVTRARWRAGHWWAMVAGAWQAVPPAVVLDRTSIFDSLAVVCHGPPPKWSGGLMAPTLFCFVPPAADS